MKPGKPPPFTAEGKAAILADNEATRVTVRKEAKAELYAAFRALGRQGAPKLERWNRAGQELRIFK